MAYTHSKYEVEVIPAQGATAVGATGLLNGMDMGSGTTVIGAWGPGFVPHLIKGAALIRVGPYATTALTGGAVQVNFRGDLTTPGTPTTMFSISMPSGPVGHKAIYHRPTYQIELKPGMLCEVNCVVAATVGIYAKAILYVEPRWEEPGNVTTMQAAT